MENYQDVFRIVSFKNYQTDEVKRLILEKHPIHREYKLHRSMVTKTGNTKHFRNNRVWYADYQLNAEYERKAFEIEETGFDLVSDYTIVSPSINELLPSVNIKSSPPTNEGILVGLDANIISVKVGFEELTVSSLEPGLRFQAPAEVTTLLDALRKDIHFLPFSAVLVYSRSESKIVLLNCNHQTEPKPDTEYAHLLHCFSRQSKSSTLKVEAYKPSTAIDNSRAHVSFHNYKITLTLIGFQPATLLVNSAQNWISFYSDSYTNPKLVYKHSCNEMPKYINEHWNALYLVDSNNEIHHLRLIKPTSSSSKLSKLTHLKFNEGDHLTNNQSEFESEFISIC